MSFFKNTLLITTLIALTSCSSIPQDPAVGMWNVNIDSPVGAIEAILSIADDGNGSLATDTYGEALSTDVVSDAGNLVFSMTINAQGQNVPLDFSGTVDGDNLNGAFDSPFGSMSVTGTRQ